MLATNRHVLAALTSGAEVHRPRRRARGVQAGSERYESARAESAPIDGVVRIHPTLDMVLLRLRPLGRPVVRVSSVTAPEETRVVVVGYPANDPANNPLFLSGVFNGQFGIKRAALGEVLDGSAAPSLYHDCSTTQGNSGSPIFDLDTGAVVGIHRAGFFMYRNEAVDADALRAFVSQ